MKKTILYLLPIIFCSCSTHMNYFEEINNNESKIKLSVISSLRYKEFLFNSSNTKDSVTIKSKRLSVFGTYKNMKYDFDKQSYVIGLEIGDYNFYNKIKNDTIFIKQGKEITLFKFLK